VAAARHRRRGALGADDPDPPLPARPVSGFSLRSSAVKPWKGMEVFSS
jgi:hypothetical protein